MNIKMTAVGLQADPTSDDQSRPKAAPARMPPAGSAPSPVDTISRPALMLVSGRAAGLAASFAIGIVLARVFDPATFGTYKQFFLVFATLYGLAQLGMAESLYYFVPRKPEHTGRYVANAMVMLALAGAVCTAALYLARAPLAAWLSNTALSDHILLLGLFLTFTLTSTVLEIVMVSHKRHVAAAVTYALSDIGRTIFFVVPALLFASLGAVLLAATIFAAFRLVATLVSLWRTFGRQLRVDVSLWRHQLAYALPFALAVGIEVVQINYHQYIVASRFDAATFAIYAVGCLQIPLVDLIMTSTVNVLMVKMAEDGTGGGLVLRLWHDTVSRLALLIFPLAVFLVVMAHNLIVGLFTTTYAASVPIFMVWSLTILPAVFAVDAVLRAYAQTRFLLWMNVMRLVIVAVLIGWFLSAFGLAGAVLVTLLATCAVKAVAMVRVARLMHVRVSEILPWGGLAATALRAGAAAIPVIWMLRALAMPPLAGLFAGGALYAAVYFSLTYLPHFLRGRSAQAAAPALSRRLKPARYVRLKHRLVSLRPLRTNEE